MTKLWIRKICTGKVDQDSCHVTWSRWIAALTSNQQSLLEMLEGLAALPKCTANKSQATENAAHVRMMRSYVLDGDAPSLLENSEGVRKLALCTAENGDV
jgi:hypothetical protein